MNQIEWCQVSLDITQETQVTRRSKLPGDPALGNLPGDPMHWEINPEIQHWEI